jgi:hypothetical protein
LGRVGVVNWCSSLLTDRHWRRRGPWPVGCCSGRGRRAPRGSGTLDGLGLGLVGQVRFGVACGYTPLPRTPAATAGWMHGSPSPPPRSLSLSLSLPLSPSLICSWLGACLFNAPDEAPAEGSPCWELQTCTGVTPVRAKPSSLSPPLTPPCIRRLDVACVACVACGAWQVARHHSAGLWNDRPMTDEEMETKHAQHVAEHGWEE